MMIIVTIVLAIIIFFKDILPAIKQKSPLKDIIVISSISAFAIALTMLHALDVKMPSPLQVTEMFVAKVLGITY